MKYFIHSYLLWNIKKKHFLKVFFAVIYFLFPSCMYDFQVRAEQETTGLKATTLKEQS